MKAERILGPDDDSTDQETNLDDALSAIADLLAEKADILPPRKGHKIHTQVNERHILGPTIRVWIEMGGDDDYASTAKQPYKELLERYRLVGNQAIRFTAYGDFPQRKDVEYDILCIVLPGGAYEIHQYNLDGRPPHETKTGKETDLEKIQNEQVKTRVDEPEKLERKTADS